MSSREVQAYIVTVNGTVTMPNSKLVMTSHEATEWRKQLKKSLPKAAITVKKLEGHFLRLGDQG